MQISDEIKRRAAADPEQVYRQAGHAGELKKQGNNLVGLCPLHPDTDPSFKISITGKHAGMFKCFGCGAAGTIVDFVKLREHLPTDAEAVRRTAKLLDITEATPAARKKPASQKPAARPGPLKPKMAEKCHEILLGNPKLLDCFMAARTLSLDIIKEVQIGFDGSRYTVPVYDEAGELMDIRKYKLGAKQNKMLPWIAKDEEKGIAGTGSTRIFGWQFIA